MLTFNSQILGVVPHCQPTAPDRRHISALIHHRDTASVAESIYEFHKENGRTYHAYRAGCTFCPEISGPIEANFAAYYYPNDLIEIERLNTQHETLKILLDGRSCLAPFDDENPPRKVLDIATGSGHWAIDLGDEFPEARIIGTDLSPIQSELVPPNVEFIIDDACVTSHCPQPLRAHLGHMN